MMINFNRFSSPFCFFKDSILSNLTAQQMRVTAIASAIIGMILYNLESQLCFSLKRIRGIENDELSGTGKITCSPEIKYEGECREGLLNGLGKITLASGTIFEGEFIDEQLNGWGKITFASGIIEEGEFRDDILNGLGKRSLANGTIYEGEFKSGRLCKSIHPQIKTSRPLFNLDDLPIQIRMHNNQDSLLDLFESFGPSSTGITERYVSYMRKVIFGFSIGQKISMEKISLESGIESLELKKTIEGSFAALNMVYIAQQVDAFISHTSSKKSDEMDAAYLLALQNLQLTLRRSLPIALMLYLAGSACEDLFLDQLLEDIWKELDAMRTEDRFLIPIRIDRHETIFAFQKMANGTFQPIFYNTGYGVKNHLSECLNLERFIDECYALGNYYPLSMKYPPIDLHHHQANFNTTMRELFKLRNKKNIKELYSILSAGFGEGKKRATKLSQINGICAFQVLSQAFKDILDSKTNYNTFKLDLLTSIQEEFQEITDAMEPLIDANDRMRTFYKLHVILLQENQQQINVAERALAQATSF